EARSLPGQAVGRGLRLMPHVGPDSQQVLEVLGTPAFEDFVRGLEGEGVHVPTERTPPRPPITVVPIQERLEFDIAIPRTGPSLERSYKRVADFDPSAVDSIFEVGDVARL